MRNLVILFVHVLATLARLWGPGGIRSVVAESVLVKQQLLILNRSRQRSPNLLTSDRLVAGLCALLIRPARLIRSAIVLRPSTLLLCLPQSQKAGIRSPCLANPPAPAGPRKTPADHPTRTRPLWKQCCSPARNTSRAAPDRS